MLREVDRFVRAHFLCKFKAFRLTVNRCDIFNTHCSENGYADKTDRSAALNDNAAVEAQDSRCFCTLNRVNKNCARLYKYSRIKVKVAYVEHGRSLSDKNIIGEPAVKVHIVIGKKSVNIRSADILLVKVKHCDIGIILKYHAGYNLIADRKLLSGAVNLYVLAHLNDFARSLVTENNRDKTEGVALKFMRVRAADSAALNLYENIAVTNLGNGIFLNVIMLKLCKHCNASRFRNRTRHTRSGSRSAVHFTEHLFYNLLNFFRIDVHCIIPFFPSVSQTEKSLTIRRADYLPIASRTFFVISATRSLSPFLPFEQPPQLWQLALPSRLFGQRSAGCLPLRPN